jgi:hypothetical protein
MLVLQVIAHICDRTRGDVRFNRAEIFQNVLGRWELHGGRG